MLQTDLVVFNCKGRVSDGSHWIFLKGAGEGPGNGFH